MSWGCRGRSCRSWPREAWSSAGAPHGPVERRRTSQKWGLLEAAPVPDGLRVCPPAGLVSPYTRGGYAIMLAHETREAQRVAMRPGHQKYAAIEKEICLETMR